MIGLRAWTWFLIGASSLAPATLQGQARNHVREGNRLYAEGRFDEAYEQYLEALREEPGSPVIRFNEGNALYRSQEFDRAMEAYRSAIESGDPALVSDAWYNLGNALYRREELEASLEAYKQALRLAPGDVDAKHNLERVLQRMQEQQQEQEQQPGGGEQDQEEQQDPGEQQDQNRPEDSQSGEDPQGQDEPRDEPAGPDEQDPNQPPQEGDADAPPEGAEGEADPREGTPPDGMTPEEAERLLEAVQEDPEDVNRKPAQPARGRLPRKKW